MKRFIYLNIVLSFLFLCLPPYGFAFEVKDKIKPPTLGFTIEEKILPSNSNFEVIDKLLPPQLELKIGDKIPALPPANLTPALINPSLPNDSTPEKSKRRKTLGELIALAKTDLAERLGIKIEEIFVKSTAEKTWSDASLGCLEKGKYYAQVITPGYLIIFEAGGKIYKYHTSLNWVTLCLLPEKTNSVNNNNSETPQNRTNTPTSNLTVTLGFAFEIKDKIKPPTLGFTIEEKILPSDSNFEVIDKLLPSQLELKISDKIPALSPANLTPALINPSLPNNSTPEKSKRRKTLGELIALAKTDLAERLGIKIEEIFVKSTAEKTWSDTSLGCPEKGKYYAQVITPGYLIIFEAGGKIYKYHTSLNWVTLCLLPEKTNSVNNNNSETPQNRTNTPTSNLTATLNLIGEKLKTTFGKFLLFTHQ